MARIDVYLRSIERFGAAGAVLTSGQAVTLRFPTGDRHATQVTPPRRAGRAGPRDRAAAWRST